MIGEGAPSTFVCYTQRYQRLAQVCCVPLQGLDYREWYVKAEQWVADPQNTKMAISNTLSTCLPIGSLMNRVLVLMLCRWSISKVWVLAWSVNWYTDQLQSLMYSYTAIPSSNNSSSYFPHIPCSYPCPRIPLRLYSIHAT